MTERRQFVGHTSTAESDQFTGLSREITIDMQAETIRVHDGTTPGGFPLARQDLANVSNTTLQSRITNKEEIRNKVSILDANVTHEQYPDARVAYNTFLTKANVDLSNLSEAGEAFIKSLGIAETSEPSEKTFVFKLGNGYIIQGGYDDSLAGWRHTIDLPVEMENPWYMALATINDGRSGMSYTTGIQSKTTTNFLVQSNNYENSHNNVFNGTLSWLVIGKYKQQED